MARAQGPWPSPTYMVQSENKVPGADCGLGLTSCDSLESPRESTFFMTSWSITAIMETGFCCFVFFLCQSSDWRSIYPLSHKGNWAFRRRGAAWNLPHAFFTPAFQTVSSLAPPEESQGEEEEAVIYYVSRLASDFSLHLFIWGWVTETTNSPQSITHLGTALGTDIWFSWMPLRTSGPPLLPLLACAFGSRLPLPACGFSPQFPAGRPERCQSGFAAATLFSGNFTNRTFQTLVWSPGDVVKMQILIQ